MYILYIEQYCPYCVKVRSFMDENGITAELRDRSKKNNREELIIRGGKPQVPYFIDTETGVEMYESEDIIEYIQANKK